MQGGTYKSGPFNSMYTIHLLKISITLPRTLIIMSTLRCSDWSQSFPQLSNWLLNQIHQTYTCISVTSWMMSQRSLNMNSNATDVNSLSSSDPISGIDLHSSWMKPWLINNLRKLSSQTAWWSTFFCATLYLSFDVWNCSYIVVLKKVVVMRVRQKMAWAFICWSMHSPMHLPVKSVAKLSSV